MNGVEFYPSKNNNALNRVTFTPELMTGDVRRAMVNPHYRVTLDPDTECLVDSGAFQELDMLARLQPWQALDRQVRLVNQIGYTGGPEYAAGVVTYDMLVGVDEAIINGRRVKRRGCEDTARPAVYETLRSAHYYATQAHRFDERTAILYAAQGATPEQYAACVREMLPLMRPHDWLAFGSFCIIGMQPSLKPLFYATIDRVLPMLASAGVRRAHILGVCVADAIQYAAAAGRRYGVRMSTDSSSIEINSIMGKVWADGRWTKVYTKEQKRGAYHPATLAHENIKRYSTWSQSL